MGLYDAEFQILDEIIEEIENNPNFPGGSLGKLETNFKKSVVIAKTILEDHEERVVDLENAEARIPIKIWEGTWSSGTLTPSTDAGHQPGSGTLSDYNIITFLFTHMGETGTFTIPQDLFVRFNNAGDLLSYTKSSKFFDFYFNSAEELQFDSNNLIQLTEIWGFK